MTWQCGHRRQARSAAFATPACTPRLYCQTPRQPGADDDARARRQPVELARRRNRPLPQQALQQRDEARPRAGLAHVLGQRRRRPRARAAAPGAGTRGRTSAGRACEPSIVPPLLAENGGKSWPTGHDRDRLRHAMHRRDVGELRPVRVLLQVAQHLVRAGPGWKPYGLASASSSACTYVRSGVASGWSAATGTWCRLARRARTRRRGARRARCAAAPAHSSR